MIASKEYSSGATRPCSPPPKRMQETKFLFKSRHERLRRQIHVELERGVQRDTSTSLPFPGRHQSARAKPERLRVNNTRTSWDCGTTQQSIRTMPPHRTERRGPSSAYDLTIRVGTASRRLRGKYYRCRHAPRESVMALNTVVPRTRIFTTDCRYDSRRTRDAPSRTIGRPASGVTFKFVLGSSAKSTVGSYSGVANIPNNLCTSLFLKRLNQQFAGALVFLPHLHGVR